MQTIEHLIDNADTIVVISHVNPDGDTVGCALAMALILQKMGKHACIACDGVLPRDMSALPHADIFGVADKTAVYDLALAVDCSTIQMLGECAATLHRATHSACIDHHATHDDFSEHDYVRIAAANAENVYDWIQQYASAWMDKEIAECLYTAIVTDSGGFTHSSVTTHTHMVAAACIGYGIDNERICYQQLKRQSLRVLRMRTEAYQRAYYEFDQRVAVVVFSLALQDKYQADIEDMTGALVDMMRAEEVLLAISMVEIKPKQYKVSVRSKRDISAAEVCQTFGGGGHRNAAGCRLTGEEGIVIDNLLEACAKVL